MCFFINTSDNKIQWHVLKLPQWCCTDEIKWYFETPQQEIKRYFETLQQL